MKIGQQVVQMNVGDVNSKLVYIPLEFENYFKLLQSEEFLEFVRINKKQDNDEDMLSTIIKKGTLKANTSMIFGFSGKSTSITDYIPDFVDYWEKKKRKDKINKILNMS